MKRSGIAESLRHEPSIPLRCIEATLVAMRSIGYMYKRISRRPEWLPAPSVVDIYSASSCISQDFCDYINYWKHNGYWLFNSPAVMERLAAEHELNLAGCTLFYYEAHDFQFIQTERVWAEFSPIEDFVTDVLSPVSSKLEGYDVSTFLCGNKPECSPLSCNYLARELTVNQHCLFSTLEDAKLAIDGGKFANTEPGPLRIFAVYSVAA
jgi:hypothetical protein